MRITKITKDISGRQICNYCGKSLARFSGYCEKCVQRPEVRKEIGADFKPFRELINEHRGA